ncbi:MAG: cation:proton antiporter [Bacteroidota bacterium]
MEELALLKEIVIILGLSIVVVFICHYFNLPPVLGFLLTGILAGPTGFAVIEASHEVEMLSEVGVILLLFVIGLEFSLKHLASISSTIFIGGSFQVGLTILGVLGLSLMLASFDWQKGLFLGFLVSLSSTAIVLKLLQEQNELNSPHGKAALGILIFQDIIVVPMMLFTPVIAGEAGNPFIAILELLAKAILVVIVVILSARYLVPKLLYAITKTRIKELFLLSIVVICFAVAWATSAIGLSLALGAFMAGLIISESEYSHQATSLIIPFREIFTSIFFVSIGMLLDLRFLYFNFPVILGLTLLVIIIKTAFTGIATLVLKYNFRVALLTGFSIFQVGEFAFILSGVGMEYHLMDRGTYQYFLSVSILTMGATPFFIKNFDWITNLMTKSRLHRQLMKWESGAPQNLHKEETGLKDHVIIIGYGLNGKNVAAAARFSSIPYVIVEMNPITVRRERAKGEPIYYGDATNPYLMEHLRVNQARVAIIAISDPNATRKVIINIRSICQTVYLIVRTRFVSEIESYQQIGANEVIPEEFETSIEIFSRLLNQYQIPEESINTFVQSIRGDNYTMLRPKTNGKGPKELEFPDMNVTCVTVQQQDNDIVGKTIGESMIRRRFNVTIVAILRDTDIINNPLPNDLIMIGDLLYVMGKPEDVSNFNEMISI